MKPCYWLLAGAMLAGSVQAMPHYGPGPGPYMGRPAVAPQTNNPAVALRAGVDRLLAFLGSENRPSPAALAGFLNNEIAPYFDFEHMAKTAGGRLYERQNEAQQQAIVEEIKRSFLTKMAEKLGGYNQQQVRFMPPRGGTQGRTAQVSAAILNPGRYPSRLEFRLYRSGDQWKVYDVAANGQSAIVHYRRQLMRQMTQQQMQQLRQQRPQMGRPMPPGYGPARMR